MRPLLLAAGLFAAAAATAAPPAVEDTMAQRVQACTVCHGKQGRAAPDGFYPRIAGKPAGYLYNQLIAFRDGRRRYSPMTNLIDPLSPAYLREIAAHFAALELAYPPPATTGTATEVLARGRRLATEGDPARRLPACTACHGASLTGVQPATPGLLGLPADYLNAQLGAWRTGERRAVAPDCMKQVAALLTAEDLAALVPWLASQPVPQDARPAAAPVARPPLECGGQVP